LGMAIFSQLTGASPVSAAVTIHRVNVAVQIKF
jgi:hypothetical protein